MSAGATSERIYGDLKTLLISGDILPGERLDPRRISGLLGSSVTPVREALLNLEGERLVETRANNGFHMPIVSEAGLRDLYIWNGNILDLALRVWVRNVKQGMAGRMLHRGPDRIRTLFTAIASTAGSSELVFAITGCNDRLAAARRAEAAALRDIDPEFMELRAAFESMDVSLLVLMRRYHARRLRSANAIVDAIYKPRLI